MRRSAALLLFRRRAGSFEVLLGHPGGPFWARKDLGAWSIPKGLIEPGEEPDETALREFAEEIGTRPPGAPVALGESRQAGGKVVTAFALEGDFDPERLAGHQVEIAWPPRSGRTLLVPELDRVAWFAPGPAREYLIGGQRVFIDRLADVLREGADGS